MKTELAEIKNAEGVVLKSDIEFTVLETEEDVKLSYATESGETDWKQICAILTAYEKQRATQNARAKLFPKKTIAERRASLFVTYKDELFALASAGNASEIEAFLQAKLDAGEGN